MEEFKPASSNHIRQAAIKTDLELGISTMAMLPTMAPIKI